MIFLWLPETKQRTLEELDYIFGVPTKKFVAYNTKVALPWWYKRWILFDKSAKLKPLYHFEGGVDGASQESDSESDRNEVGRKDGMTHVEEKI